MHRLDLPVIVVAHCRTGHDQSHAADVEALRAAKLDVLGVIFNQVQSDVSPDESFLWRDNPPTIARIGGVPILGKSVSCAV